jgi:hypothetical protein
VTDEAESKPSDHEEILPERTVIDMLGYTWALCVPTVSLTLLNNIHCFEKHHHQDRLVFINAAKMKGLHIVEKLVGWAGRRIIYSPPEKLELEVLSATTKDPKKFYEDLKAHYGTTEITVREANAWVRLQGFSDATVSELHYFYGESQLLTIWERLMLHRSVLKSAWKKQIRDFHRDFGVRAHPAFLVLTRAYLAGLEIPVHDKRLADEHLAPFLRNSYPLPVDFAEKEKDYHEWVAMMLEKTGLQLPLKKRKKLLDER